MDIIPDSVAGVLADLVLIASVLAALFYLIKRVVAPFISTVLIPFVKSLFKFGKTVISEEEEETEEGE